jgi:hypothetical protein
MGVDRAGFTGNDNEEYLKMNKTILITTAFAAML